MFTCSPNEHFRCLTESYFVQCTKRYILVQRDSVPYKDQGLRRQAKETTMQFYPCDRNGQRNYCNHQNRKQIMNFALMNKHVEFVRMRILCGTRQYCVCRCLYVKQSVCGSQQSRSQTNKLFRVFLFCLNCFQVSRILAGCFLLD